MTTPAEKIDCPNCGHKADPVHRVHPENGGKKFQGWFCPYCGHIEPPTGREIGLDLPQPRR